MASPESSQSGHCLDDSSHSSTMLLQTFRDPYREETPAFNTLSSCSKTSPESFQSVRMLYDSSYSSTTPLDEFQDSHVEEALTLTVLPTEIVERIAQHLPLRGLRMLRRTCKRLETQTLHYFIRMYCTCKHVVIVPAQLRSLFEQAVSPKFGTKLKELVFETWNCPHKQPLQTENLKYHPKEAQISKAIGYLVGAFEHLPNVFRISMKSKPKDPGCLLTTHAIMVLSGLWHKRSEMALNTLELPGTGNYICWDLFMWFNGGFLNGPIDTPIPFRTITNLFLSLNGRYEGVGQPHSPEHSERSLRVFLSNFWALESLSLELGEMHNQQDVQNLGRISELITEQMTWPGLRYVHLRGFAFIKGSFLDFLQRHHQLRRLSLEETVFSPHGFNKLCQMVCHGNLTFDKIEFKKLFRMGEPGPVVTPASQVAFPVGEMRETTTLVAEKGEIEERLRGYLYYNA